MTLREALPPLPKPFMDLASGSPERRAWQEQMHAYARTALAQPAAPAQPVAWRVQLEGMFFHGASREGLIAAIGVKLGRSIAESEAQPLYAAAQAAQPAPQPLTADVVRDMLDETRDVFDASGPETPQVVRDVIEYVASWLAVYADKRGITAAPTTDKGQG